MAREIKLHVDNAYFHLISAQLVDEKIDPGSDGFLYSSFVRNRFHTKNVLSNINLSVH